MLNYRQVRQHHLEHIRKRPSPARDSKILVFGFALIILLGTFFLSLPIATESTHDFTWREALFTATSATTVTGLVVAPTEETFTTFGEIVILALMQVGGIGFITLSVILFRLIGRRVNLHERNLLRQSLGVEAGGGIIQLTLTVLLITIITEGIGAVALFTQWIQVMDWPQAVYYSIFHAVSAYCNAGFDLFHSLDDPYLLAARNSPISLITLSILILIGGLGITAIYDLIVWPRERILSLHTRLVLILTLFLTVSGTIVVMLDETFIFGQALQDTPMGWRWLVALFTVISSRTAGVTLISLPDLGQASQLILLVWMFIGGAPASMAGGAGISTVAVVLVTLASSVRGHSTARTFGRTLPMETIFKAVAIMTLSTALVTLVTLILALLHEGDIFPLAFEVISAFSNTGYSLGMTGSLSQFGRALLIFTMFWGRLGPLTLVVALAQRDRQSLIYYPEERIIIG
jgi:trk system potassium uptake protein TrkH